MKILLINGSPKGAASNTRRLSGAFLEGIARETAVETREICPARMDIRPCIGCFSCWNKTPGKCCLEDDMSGVIESMLWADVIVWSFPLYYFSVPGPLKNLMDRQLPMVLPFMNRDSASGGHPSRYDMSGKRHVVISTCGFYTSQGNYDGVNALFDHICGKGKYTSIYCGQGELFRVKELSSRTDEYLSWVTDAGGEFARGGISRETREKLSSLLFPREVFEAMADASWGVEESGEKSDESLVFTRQMAALYNPKAWSGKNLVLEMQYTDIGKRYQILLEKEGSRVLTENFVQPTTTIETTYTLWKAIAAGEIRGEEALMQQKYKVRGDFNLMIFWDKYFGSQTEEPKTVHKVKPTSMALLLLPWIAFWSATASQGANLGALISMAVCALLPLLFFKKRQLIYDQLSGGYVTVLSLGILFGAGMDTMLLMSYLGFGALWTIMGFAKIPLTAYYSQNDYGGEGMMDNPLFLKTNRILTLCWGFLYLAMTVWTFALKAFPWVVTVNSLLPAVLGIFTLWFQKWYPAYVARGK